MRILDAARLVKPAYKPDWFHELIAEHLEACVDGTVPNLLISTPPGMGKTELISILFPAWLLAERPFEHVIELANSDVLARMASGNVLRLLNHPALQEKFPLEFDKQTEGSFTIHGNDGRPSLHAAGILGQVTGQRASFLLFDDLIKNQQDAFSEVIRNRVWDNFLSAAETRLLPEGKIVGIMTRWHLDDPVGRLLRRAEENPVGRQFIYINLAAWNSGTDSYVLDTRTGERRSLPKYRALARGAGQPYSFTRSQLESKRADLGPTRWAALYMGNPVAGDAQLFPPEEWPLLEGVNTDDLQLIVTSWDCASKTGASNDYSANVAIGRTYSGRFIVLDVWKAKVDFSELPHIVLARYQALTAQFKTLPLLVVEDTSAGTQLLQIIEAEAPNLPKLAGKPAGKSKVVRAEAVTPYTRGRIVYLLKNAEWLDAFIAECANFPVGQHDDVVDAFCQGLKAFISGGDFKAPDFGLFLPGHQRQPGYDELAQGVVDGVAFDTTDGTTDDNFGRGDF